MPSLMATLGLDATNFNQNAEKVISKAEQVGRKVSQSGISRAKAFDPMVGLASDPKVMLSEFEIAEKAAKAKDTRRNSIAREAIEAKRQDSLERDRLRSEKAAHADRVRMYAQATQEGRRAGYNAKQLNREILDEAKAGMPKGGSMLGGAAKIFGAYVVGSFLKNQTQELVSHSSMLVAVGKRLKEDTSELDAWDKALKSSGSSLKDVEPVLDKFNKNRVAALSGNAKQMDAFSQLGISRDQLKTLKTTDLAMLIGKSFESGDGTEQMLAALQRVGGDGATALVQAFQEGLPNVIQQVKDAGQVMSDGMIANFKAMGDRWGEIGATLKTNLLGPLAAGLGWFGTQLVGDLTDVFGTVAQGVKGWWKADGIFNTAGFTAMGDEIARQNERDSKRNNEIQRAKLGIKDESPKTNVNVEDKAKKRDADKAAREEAQLKKQAQHEINRELEENAKLGKHSVNSLQEMGGFLGNFALASGPETAALNAQVKSEEHLRHIIDILKQKKTAENPSDVDY